MSSNLLKRGYTFVKEDDARVIDSNALMAQKMSQPTVKRITPKPEDKDGFSAGLAADVLDVLTQDSETEDEMAAGAGDSWEQAGAVADMGPSVEELREQALFEIEEMKKEAEANLQMEKEQVLTQARNQGYQEGFAKGQQETETARRALEEERKNLNREFEKQLDELEPVFVDTIADIYEHIFKVELSGYRDIVVNLIANTLRKIEGGKAFMVHVSKEDYPYVSMQKKQLEVGVATGNSVLEIIEDITLSKNQALIETEGGIYDCSLGTQLEELHQKLLLLSYEKSSDNES